MEAHFPGLPHGRARIYFEVEVYDDEALLVNTASSIINIPNFMEIHDNTNNTYHVTALVPVREYYYCYTSYRDLGQWVRLQEPTYTWVPERPPRNNYGVPPGRLNSIFRLDDTPQRNPETYRFFAWSTQVQGWEGACQTCGSDNPNYHYIDTCGRPADGIPEAPPGWNVPDICDEYCDPDCQIHCDADCDCDDHEPPYWLRDHVLYSVTETANNSIVLFFVPDVTVFTHLRDYGDINHIFRTIVSVVPGRRPYMVPLAHRASFVTAGQDWHYRAWSRHLANFNITPPAPIMPPYPGYLPPTRSTPPEPFFTALGMSGDYNLPPAYGLAPLRRDVNLYFTDNPRVTVHFNTWIGGQGGGPIPYFEHSRQREIMEAQGYHFHPDSLDRPGGFHENIVYDALNDIRCEVTGILWVFTGYYQRLGTNLTLAPPDANPIRVTADSNGVFNVRDVPNLSYVMQSQNIALFYEPVWDIHLIKTNHIAVPLNGALFHLYRYTPPADSDYEGHGAAVTQAGIDAGYWTLAATATSGDRGITGDVSLRMETELLSTDIFHLVERAAPSGFQLPTGQWRVNLGTNAAGNVEVTGFTAIGSVPAFSRNLAGNWSVSNMPSVVRFAFHKTDQRLYNEVDPMENADWERINNQLLIPGAHFSVFAWQGAAPPPADMMVSQANINAAEWVLIDSGISTGDVATPIAFDLNTQFTYFQLVETQAPQGFDIPWGQWRLSVRVSATQPAAPAGQGVYESAGSDFWIRHWTICSGVLPTLGFVRQPAGELYGAGEWYVGNRAILNLPLTGGSGSNAFIMGGMMIILLAGGVFMFHLVWSKSKVKAGAARYVLR